jgi:hypothetical protein
VLHLSHCNALVIEVDVNDDINRSQLATPCHQWSSLAAADSPDIPRLLRRICVGSFTSQSCLEQYRQNQQLPAAALHLFIERLVLSDLLLKDVLHRPCSEWTCNVIQELPAMFKNKSLSVRAGRTVFQ